MHIKTVIIEGFKTYKNAVMMDPFDPGHNVILGKNGSGKSNIFDAIQFVLSDKYSNLKQDERKSLLHEGSGKEIMTASVEVKFDNTDMRFPVDKEEVSIKRTIGLKKDEYFLDNKHVNKQEVTSLLESAGLSRSNPYYIVQQGKVRSLIKMKPSERLELLKEIAGTRTYDDRRKESLKIMGETDKRVKQIDEVTGYIESRLSELEEEQQELKKYHKLDSERRCLEYAMYERERADAAGKLESMESVRESTTDRNNRLHGEVASTKKARQECEEELNVLAEVITKLKGEKKTLSKESRTLQAKQADTEMKVKSMTEQVESSQNSNEEAQAELASLDKEIAKKSKSLDNISTDYKEKLKNEEDTKERIWQLEQRLAELYDKQGRKDQFKSKKDRDAFLLKQVDVLQKSVKTHQKQLDKTSKINVDLKAKIDAVQKDIEGKDGALDSIKSDIDGATEEFQSLKSDRNDQTNLRKEMWREIDTLEEDLRKCKTTLDKAEKSMQYTMDRTMFKGLETVRQIVAEKKLKGVHGSLIELFDCDPKFQKCVETTAGNSLFNVVVDSDEIAALIIKELNKRNSGRVTFIPLAQLKYREEKYPNHVDVIPMIEKLNYDKKYKKAMSQVFGKTLITRTIEIASSYAREHNFNTITLKGDSVNKKGALTGGYMDQKHSRLATQASIKEARQQFEDQSALLEKQKKSVAEKAEHLDRVSSKLDRHMERRTHLRRTQSQVQMDIASLSKAIKIQKDEYERNLESIKSLDAQIQHLEEKKEGLEEEAASEFLNKLTDADQAEMHKSIEEVAKLKKDLVNLIKRRSQAETAKTVLENLLNTNLLKRKEELENNVNGSQADENTVLLEKENSDLTILKDNLEALQAKLKANETNLETAQAKDKKLSDDVEKFRKKEAKAQENLSKESKTAERLLGKRSVLLQKSEDSTRKIRELGSLPSEAYEDKYKKLKIEQIMKKLSSVGGKLKDFTHVNKKAIDQFHNFTEQKENLMARKEELDKARQAIIDLIEHLDQKKDAAIERTFKGIAKHFSIVFAELVPGGKGTLIMETRKKGKGEEGEDKGTLRYSGVGIKVSFTGVSGSDQSMLQLSGGQQSVVALSLIFAIQRCDPSPFYLFDEIDSNLDAVHRASVARMIKNQSKEIQFLTTTFRPEHIATANKFYGVSFQNKMSRSNVLTKKEAKELILVVEKEYEADTKAAKKKK